MENLINFFKTEYTFTLTGVSITALTALILAGIIGLLYLIINLYKRLKFAETPKYGFMGKPLYQMVALGVLSFGLVFTIYNASKDTKIDDSSAKEEISIDVRVRKITEYGNSTLVEVDITPLINNNEWGESFREFDIYVNGNGPTQITEILMDKTEATQAKFSKTLPNGTYTMTFTIVTEDKTYTFFETINL